jgi:hypothetical protein
LGFGDRDFDPERLGPISRSHFSIQTLQRQPAELADALTSCKVQKLKNACAGIIVYEKDVKLIKRISVYYYSQYLVLIVWVRAV